MKPWIIAALAIGLATAGSAVAYAQRGGSEEEPEHTVERAKDDFEVRSYAPMIVAEITHSGERRRALNAGFRRLAAYIFAQDRPGGAGEKIAMTSPVMQDPPEKIEMTSPVLTDAVGADTWRTRFVMPARFTMETLPQAPADITLTQVPARRMAAVRFSGVAGNMALRAQENRLRDWMASEGLEPAGAAEFAFYDAPMVPGPLRRNEVLIPLD